MSRRALVIGARGQIGGYLLPLLMQNGWQVDATARAVQAPDRGGVTWYPLELYAGADTAPVAEVVFSLGPLDGFAAWFARSARRPKRVVAFGSTSAATKQDSRDARERELAARLEASERLLAQTCLERGVWLTVLRPTLIYGAGQDRNIRRIAALAHRWGFFVLPRGANGRRQPVHAEDLADAARLVAESESLLAASYDLPGGETLEYREMVQRVLAALHPPRRLIEIPQPPLRAALWCARRIGALDGASTAVIDRMQRDLVFDAGPARRDFGYAPRAFLPRASML